MADIDESSVTKELIMHSNSPKMNARHRAAALSNPSRVYSRPAEVLTDPGLDDPTRRRILQGWALDEERLMVSTDENMTGGRESRLAAVASALRVLDAHEEPEPSEQ